MLLPHEPTDVGEEVAATRVVRVTVSVGELVVHTVIPAPDVDAVLPSNRLPNSPEGAEREAGVVGLVGPQAMRSAADREACPVACPERTSQ